MGFSLLSKKLLLVRRPLEDDALLCSPIRRNQVQLHSATSRQGSLQGAHRVSFIFSDHCFTYAAEKNDHGTEETSRASRNGHSRLEYLEIILFLHYYYFFNRSSVFSSAGEAQKDPGRARVPVVCLERLKILVSQLPPHGRRQSDPLPASGTEAPPPPQSTWQAAVNQV